MSKKKDKTPDPSSASAWSHCYTSTYTTHVKDNVWREDMLQPGSSSPTCQRTQRSGALNQMSVGDRSRTARADLRKKGPLASRHPL